MLCLALTHFSICTTTAAVSTSQVTVSGRQVTREPTYNEPRGPEVLTGLYADDSSSHVCIMRRGTRPGIVYVKQHELSSVRANGLPNGIGPMAKKGQERSCTFSISKYTLCLQSCQVHLQSAWFLTSPPVRGEGGVAKML